MKQIAKALIVNQEGRVLLAQRSISDDWDAGLWSLPGGEVQPGEKLYEALQREVAEEVGLEVKVCLEPQGIYYYPDNQVESATAVVSIFTIDRWKGEVSLNIEHSKAAWFSKQQWQQLKLAPSARWTLNEFLPSLRFCSCE